MFFKRIEVSNFKSFDKLEVDLGRLNVLIGANASGKSNFVQVFKFLRDIVNDGLENAVSLQGGVQYLRNTYIDLDKEFSIKTNAKIDKYFPLPIWSAEYSIDFTPDQLWYGFGIGFKKRMKAFTVLNDHLILEGDFRLGSHRQAQKKTQKISARGELESFYDRGQLSEFFSEASDEPVLKGERIIPMEIGTPAHEELPPRILMLETERFLSILPLQQALSNISIYDFNPSKMKQAVLIAGKRELEEDGGNISLVLKNLLYNKIKRERFLNLLQDMLPFVKNLKTSTFADKSLHFSLKENFLKEQYFPASFLSDGTINLIALIIALFFDEKNNGESNLVIFEEPEKHIHPSLISRMMNLFKEASEKKQIIITTHNPEVVKHTELENLLFISRDEDGFSTITRPGEKHEVKTFLENEIGIEELFVQDLLGV